MTQLGDLKRLVRRAFDAAVAAGHPGEVTRAAMARLDSAPTAVIAVGKAAASMAQAVRDSGCDAPGILVNTDESFTQVTGMTGFASAHPVPDDRGIQASAAVTDLVDGLGEGDHLLLLVSGGGSALLPAPAEGMGLADKQALNEALLASGLDIHDMNAVRRLFSTLKGGRLARRAAPAKVTQFLLSDVPGDRLESIASGPAIADPVPLETSLELIRAAGLDRLGFMPEQLRRIAAGEADLPVRPGDPVTGQITTHLLASNAICRDAAADVMRRALGSMDELQLPDLEGEASDCAADLAERVLRARGAAGVWAVTGGETTVQLGDSPGLGGRAQEMGIAFTAAMQAQHGKAAVGWTALIGGTDGRDGPTDAAGAIIGGDDPFDGPAAAAALAAHDSYRYLDANGQLLKVPPTGTNLGDIAILVAGSTSGMAEG